MTAQSYQRRHAATADHGHNDKTHETQSTSTALASLAVLAFTILALALAVALLALRCGLRTASANTTQQQYIYHPVNGTTSSAAFTATEAGHTKLLEC